MTAVGRKRAFDKANALEKAMHVFWKHGYAGTSLTDLTNALGINKPSLYAAFGNKEQLFNAALDHYVQTYGTQPLKQLREPAALPFAQRLENYLLAVIENNTHEALPVGCFVVKSYCEAGGNGMPKEAESALNQVSINNEKMLEELFLNEQQKGQLDSAANVKALANFVLAQIYGISVMARRGKTRQELKAIAKTSLKTMV